MENAKRNLKFISEVMLILLLFSAIRMILEIFLKEIRVDNIPAEFILVVKGVLCVISALLYIPQIYIGVKGIRVAKNPDSSKAHIVWAVIFFVFAAISVISTVSGMIRTGNVVGNIFGLIDSVIDLGLCFFYVKFAKQVQVAA